MQYEILSLGKHFTDQPCQSVCVLHSELKNKALIECDFDAPLINSKKQLKLQPHVDTLVALGSKGKVDIYSVFWATLQVSVCLDPAVLSGINEALSLCCFPGFEDDAVPETLIFSLFNEKPDIRDSGKITMASYSMHQRLINERKLILDIKKVTEFTSPGKSSVTALAETSIGTLIVVEMLHSLSIFQIQETGDMVQLALQCFSHPIQAVAPVSEDTILVAVYSQGLQLMQRNLQEELVYQVYSIVYLVKFV
eukprot:c20504_g1_i4 orf=60-815(-)